MEELSYRVRLAALWVMNMIAFFAYRTIAISEGATEVSVLSNMELATILVLLMVFAFLTLLLGRKNNRPMNIIAGTVFGIGELALFIDGITGYPSAPFNVMTGAAVVLMVSVVWLARKWPKRQS